MKPKIAAKEMRTRTRQDGVLLGTIFSVGAPQVAEIIAMAGFDWVLIDMEHSTLSLDSVQAALQSAGDGIIRIVRVPGNDDIWIKRVLDTGCDGILVPMVKNAGEASRAVASSKYPTEGQRSVGLTRAHGYGSKFSEYIGRANTSLTIMIQIEHIEGVRNIDSILKVNGISAIFIGPYDLSASMGLIGQPGHRDVKAAIGKVKEKCKKAGIPWGIFGATPGVLHDEISDGCKYLLCGVDSAVLLDSYKAMLSDLRK